MIAFRRVLRDGRPRRRGSDMFSVMPGLTSNPRTVDVLISVDVEADGPIPGPYSMISLGACVAGTRTKDAVTVIDPDVHTFYCELKPISDQFEPDTLAISGMTRKHLMLSGQDPAVAMSAFADWVDKVGRELGGTPVFCAYPLGYDWIFAYWYLMRFAGRSPFSHGRHLDVKTAFSVMSGQPVARSSKRFMPKRMRGSRPHTHNALDDAKGQADLLANILVRAADR